MNKNYYNYNSGMKYGCNDKKKAPEVCEPCNNSCPDDSYVVGNSIDFCIDKCDSEIKADITVSYRESVRVWGQIKDCSCKPVPYAYLKLIKITPNGCYEGIAHTISDCLGFYQFDVCPCTDGTCFRILVGKASIGGVEKVLASEANCNPCSPNSGVPQCDCR